MSPISQVLHQAGHRGAYDDPVVTFLQQLRRVNSERKAKSLARDFYYAMAMTGHPFQQGSAITFWYYAPKAREVFVAGDFNHWHSRAERMSRVGNTGLFVHRRPHPGRSAYKFVVDGRWKEDPANPLTHDDGHGALNSVIHPGHGPTLITHPDFYSKSLRNRRPLVIYLPPGYHAEVGLRYPVLYVMDGRENVDRGQLPQLFETEIRTGRLPPFIAVFIPHKGRGRNNEYTPYFKNSKLDRYHRFMALELVPFIDKMFRTRPDRDSRTLLGQSFGGTVVTSLAARAPHLFRNVLAQSGVYIWGRRSVLYLLETTPRPDIRLYVDCVANRTEQTQNRMLVQVLKAKGYPYYYRAIPSRHEYEDWRVRVPDGLRYLWSGVTPGS